MAKGLPDFSGFKSVWRDGTSVRANGTYVTTDSDYEEMLKIEAEGRTSGGYIYSSDSDIIANRGAEVYVDDTLIFQSNFSSLLAYNWLKPATNILYLLVHDLDQPLFMFGVSPDIFFKDNLIFKVNGIAATEVTWNYNILYTKNV